MQRGIDYLIKGGKSGCIDDPRALMAFYRRVASHPEFKPRLGLPKSNLGTYDMIPENYLKNNLSLHGSGIPLFIR